MFERLRRIVKKISSSLEGEPDAFDHPRPQRANPDPPKDEWFGRTSKRSARVAAAEETKALDWLDRKQPDPALSREASREVDDLLAKHTKTRP